MSPFRKTSFMLDEMFCETLLSLPYFLECMWDSYSKSMANFEEKIWNVSYWNISSRLNPFFLKSDFGSLYNSEILYIMCISKLDHSYETHNLIYKNSIEGSFVHSLAGPLAKFLAPWRDKWQSTFLFP